jgi:hypothetical protein
VAYAQTTISNALQGITNGQYRISVDRNYVFNNCEFTLNFEWGDDFWSGGDIYYLTIKMNGGTSQIQITQSLKSYTLNPGTASAGTSFDITLQITKTPGFPASGPYTITMTYIDYPELITGINGQDLYDYYYGRTTQYAGKVEFSRRGGSPDLKYSVDRAHWNPFPGVTASLTPLDIQNLIPGSQIWIREPYGCMEVPAITVPDPNQGGRITRQVYIPSVADATLIPSPGIHYVESGKNYIFKIIPTGGNAGLTPQVRTNRHFIADEQGVSCQESDAGVWIATLYAVQEPVNLEITFVGAETKSVTSVAPVEGQQVWGSAGSVCITSATAGEARIYGGAGALVKTVSYAPGTTATPLSPGFYIASLEHGAYKVIVK